MFGIFNNVIRNSTGMKDWSAPDNWKRSDHRSTYERQKDEAAKHRAALVRQTRLPF